MTREPVRVQLRREADGAFVAENAAGERIPVGMPEDAGGGPGLRPMQLILAGLAGCMSVDILHILEKGRYAMDDLQVDVEGWRADAVPAVYEKILMRVRASGDCDSSRLERAVALSLEKYCSVAKMLAPTVELTTEVEMMP